MIGLISHLISLLSSCFFSNRTTSADSWWISLSKCILMALSGLTTVRYKKRSALWMRNGCGDDWCDGVRGYFGKVVSRGDMNRFADRDNAPSASGCWPSYQERFSPIATSPAIRRAWCWAHNRTSSWRKFEINAATMNARSEQIGVARLRGCVPSHTWLECWINRKKEWLWLCVASHLKAGTAGQISVAFVSTAMVGLGQVVTLYSAGGNWAKTLQDHQQVSRFIDWPE